MTAELQMRDQELIELKESMVDYFDNNNVPMHQVSVSGIIVRANKAELHSLGYTAEEYVGHSIAEFHHDKEIVADLLNKLINNEEIWRQDAQMIHKDGHLIDVKITSSRGKGGGLTRCLTMPTHLEDKLR